ncbi:DUF805 domain-containing protein [Sphingobium abikonense]|uniref:DUF805 domain-containing protein n=1 Tax=Sphingobium abikonense TaxID=86193 RepID=UPI000AEBD32A|nr:DUF805 domain-containing protein [Sphingobium abikonense]
MVDTQGLHNLEKLNQLMKDGVISEAEFERSKESLLFGKDRTATKPSVLTASNPAADDYFGWMLLPLRRYAQFTGRASRKEFWLFQLVPIALFSITLVFTMVDRDAYDEIGAVGNLAIGLFVLGILALIVPALTVQVRRFHDQDRSGWFVLLNLIPYIGALAVLVFMLLEGTAGDNRFGPNPIE